MKKFILTALLGLTMAGSLQAGQITLFSDNMENGANGWTNWGSTDGVNLDGGLWHQSQRRSYSTNTAWYYGFETYGTDDIGETIGTLTSPWISLVGVTNST